MVVFWGSNWNKVQQAREPDTMNLVKHSLENSAIVHVMVWMCVISQNLTVRQDKNIQRWDD